jgi:DNA invertase Pin-like site-specific DNA recombinase
MFSNAKITILLQKFVPFWKNIMIYGYIRVSSDKQTVENQRFEINKFCERKGLKIDDWIEETISGTKDYSKRQLGPLLKKVQKNDMIICSELSRLGRTLFMIMDILNICMTKECRVWTIKDNYRLGDDIQSKVLAFAFGLSAEIERNLISQRTKEALARKKAEGKKIGHYRGFHCRLNPTCEKNKELIIKSLGNGHTKVQIAKKLKISEGTLYRYLVYTGLFTPKMCNQEGWKKYGIFH